MEGGVYLSTYFLTLRTYCWKWVTIHLDSFVSVVEALFVVCTECGDPEGDRDRICMFGNKNRKVR